MSQIRKVMRPAVEVELSELSDSRETQIRKCHAETVAQYALSYEAKQHLPPLKAYFDETRYWLADGFHRRDALLALGHQTALVCVFKGSKRDALIDACKANTKNGRPLTSKEKRAAIQILLNDEEYADESDRNIALLCGASHPTVSEVRKKLMAGNSSKDEPIEVDALLTISKDDPARRPKRPKDGHALVRSRVDLPHDTGIQQQGVRLAECLVEAPDASIADLDSNTLPNGEDEGARQRFPFASPFIVRAKANQEAGATCGKGSIEQLRVWLDNSPATELLIKLDFLPGPGGMAFELSKS